MINIMEKVAEIKNKLHQAEETRNKLEGKKDHLMSELKKEYQVETIPQAKEVLTEMGSKLQELEDNIQASVKKLEEELEDVN